MERARLGRSDWLVSHVGLAAMAAFEAWLAEYCEMKQGQLTWPRHRRPLLPAVQATQ